MNVDLRPQLAAVKDQGPRGTCLAFALTAAHEHLLLSIDPVEDLAEEVLYWACKLVDQDRAPGTSFASAATALIETGQPHEKVWPYNPLCDDTDISYHPPAGAIGVHACYRARAKPLAGGLDVIKQSLDRGLVVAFGLPITHGFVMAAQGVIPMPAQADQFIGLHAILAVGYDENRALLLFRNSWGDTWGDGGYGYLPYEYLRQRVQETWVIEESLNCPTNNESGR